MIVNVDNRSGVSLPESDYKALAEFVLAKEGTAADVELSISLVEESEIHALNKSYRGIDAPTDVLSFENDEELLGDVIICPAVAKQHALDFDSDLASEMELMLTHGILHLKGYEHDDDESAEVMEARENELLRAWRAL